MKRLLTKTTRPFVLYVLIILMISIPVYYFVVDAIWLRELDEHNEIVADKTIHQINTSGLTDDALEKSIVLLNIIQPGSSIEKVIDTLPLKDSTYTIETIRSYAAKPVTDRFRCLRKKGIINGQPYFITVATNVEESAETILVIAITTLFFFFLIVAGLLLLTRRLSKTVWQPFRDMLEKVKSFNLNHQTRILFAATDTTEFQELNQSLTRLIEHTIAVYKAQKEFTENASHELQTPLAIIRNKLDLLLQDKDLTESQYTIVEELNRALTRSTRLNRNLLLLAKIENRQFANKAAFNFSEIVSQNIEILRQHFELKELTVHTDIADPVIVNGSKDLAEVLVSNLLVNAIKHTPAAGVVLIRLNTSRLEVANSGSEPLPVDSLFLRFSALSDDSSGSGLGLAIVKEIAAYEEWTLRYHFEEKQHLFSIAF